MELILSNIDVQIYAKMMQMVLNLLENPIRTFLEKASPSRLFAGWLTVNPANSFTCFHIFRCSSKNTLVSSMGIFAQNNPILFISLLLLHHISRILKFRS